MKEQIHAFLTSALRDSCQLRVHGVILSGKQPPAPTGYEVGTAPTAEMSKVWKITKPSASIVCVLTEIRIREFAITSLQPPCSALYLLSELQDHQG